MKTRVLGILGVLVLLSTLSLQLREASRRSLAKADQPARGTGLTRILVVAMVLFVFSFTAFAQGTAFTYQGRLNDGANPATGIYDLRFTIYDSPSGGLVAGGPLTNAPTSASNGLFTVTLDFGAGVFTGPARWLEIGVRTNGGAGAYQPLTPRQPLTSTPYAVTAGNVTGVIPGGSLSGTYPGAVTLNNAANSFTGNGAGMTSLNASQLASGTVPAATLGNAWKTAGNSGTSPTNGNFLGTMDNQPLELWVNQARALRLEPGTNVYSVVGAPNVIGGAPNNFVDAGIFGATIAGGGAVNMTGFLPGPSSNHVGASFGTIGGGRLNTVNADHGAIGGGLANTIGYPAYDSVIGGGYANTISSNNNSFRCVIGGGSENTNGGLFNTIGGGERNTVPPYADYSTVGGGSRNTASGYAATVPGGFANLAQGDWSFAAGQNANALYSGSFVWSDDSSGSFFSTTANQFCARAGGGVRFETAGAGMTLDGQAVATSNQLTNLDAANLTSGTLAAARMPALTGDVTTTGGSVATTLANTTVTPGSYSAANITVDAKGRVTAAANGASAATASSYVFAISGSLQPVLAANIFRDATFDIDFQINGWAHAFGTAAYTNTQSGLYLIEYTAKAMTTGAPDSTNVSVVAVLNSLQIPGSQNSADVPFGLVTLSKSFIANVNAADVLRLQFTGTGTGIALTADGGSGIGAAKSSISMTIVRIQ